jgi:polyphosphate glucokinase
MARAPASRAGSASAAGRAKARKVLAVDIGGSHVKILATGRRAPRRVDSGPELTAQRMAEAVKALAEGWDYDVVSLGYPGPVLHNKPLLEPINLGGGWCGFDYEGAFGRPVKIVNDALMQAVGSYEGGRMLFLGLGTGLGSAMIVDKVAQPMELAHLPYRKGRTFEDFVGAAGLARLGKKRWRKEVFKVVERLQAALEPDYIVLGGGGIKKLDELPPGCRRGDNANAFKGGFRLWQEGAILV